MRLPNCETSIPKTNSKQLDKILGQNIAKALIIKAPLQQNLDRKIHDLDSTVKMQMTCPEEDRFNETIMTLLSEQQDKANH